jgi:hypothetical protein
MEMKHTHHKGLLVSMINNFEAFREGASVMEHFRHVFDVVYNLWKFVSNHFEVGRTVAFEFTIECSDAGMVE